MTYFPGKIVKFVVKMAYSVYPKYSRNFYIKERRFHIKEVFTLKKEIEIKII